MYSYEYDDMYEPEYRCRHCEEKEQMIDEAGDFLRGIIDHLYGTDELNKPNLQHCIDELCQILGVVNQHSDLQIARSIPHNPKVEPFIKDWLQYNETYLRDLV